MCKRLQKSKYNFDWMICYYQVDTVFKNLQAIASSEHDLYRFNLFVIAVNRDGWHAEMNVAEQQPLFMYQVHLTTWNTGGMRRPHHLVDRMTVKMLKSICFNIFGIFLEGLNSYTNHNKILIIILNHKASMSSNSIKEK